MEDRYLYKAKRIDNGEWVKGYYLHDDICNKSYIFPRDSYANESDKVGEEGCLHLLAFEVDPSTICQCTGLPDKNSKKIWENDITRLVLPNGEVRYFKVSFKKVVREVVCHPDFDDDVAKVELNAVCFEWNSYDLFPCVDVAGISDVAKMAVVGNIFDNPELLEGELK